MTEKLYQFIVMHSDGTYYHHHYFTWLKDFAKSFTYKQFEDYCIANPQWVGKKASFLKRMKGLKENNTTKFSQLGLTTELHIICLDNEYISNDTKLKVLEEDLSKVNKEIRDLIPEELSAKKKKLEKEVKALRELVK